MIFLGDQSPWVGGLLRLAALEAVGEEVEYFLADLDTPGVGTGPLSVHSGWPSYSALANRNPWTLDAPGAEKLAVQAVQNSLRAPPGMQYLTGTGMVLAKLNQDSRLVGLVREMLETEVSWSQNISRTLGVESRPLNFQFGGLREAADGLRTILGAKASVKSMMELFTGNPPRLWGKLPRTYFWEVHPWGGRMDVGATGRDSGIIVPRGKIMPLELMARGYELGCTNLSYIGEVAQIRNQFLPGLPIRLVKVKFHWTLPSGADPLQKLSEQFLGKKRERLALKKQPLSSLRKTEEEVAALADQARQYWQGRPSVISYLTLGGSLGVTITREIL